MKYQVLLFYKYVTVDEPQALAERLRESARKHNLFGRILVAEEGLNGTVEGLFDDTELFAKELLSEELFSDMQIKRSEGNGEAFRKLYVKVREEIVGTRFPKEVDPRVKTAPRISAEELRNWFESGEEFEIVDMRNDYEYQSGHFKNSINPELENSRDLPDALPKLEPLKKKKILTVCTGGVRCEKMSALLLKEGFEDVYQLDNGIHGYMEKFPGMDFEGTLYTFDKRLTMDFGGDRSVIGKCYLCKGQSETYVNCKNNYCHLHFLVCENCAGEDGTFCSEACESFVPPVSSVIEAEEIVA